MAFADYLALETEHHANIGRMEDTTEAFKAFPEARAPEFIGHPDYAPSSSELRTRNAIDLDGSPEAANRRPGLGKRRRMASEP